MSLRSRGGARPGAGRPRLDADIAILSAARSLLRRVGFQRLTVDAVAKEAKVSTGTVYRRWPNKTALAVAAFSDTIGPSDPADTGSLQGDLQAMVADFYDFFAGEHGQLLTSLLTAVGDDTSVLAEVRRSTRLRRAGLRKVLQRAVDRGELAADADLDLLSDLIVGPFWTRLLLTGERITRPLINKLLGMTADLISR